VSRYVKEDKLIIRFGQKIKQLRLERKLTQEELAIEADIPVRSIKRIENAQVITSIAHACRLAKGLGVPLSELFDFI
jgi:transcriptional regulator with XRE-family HTH domain